MTQTEEQPNASAIPENPFSPDDLKQFDADDAEAGRAIGKMLAIFFFYTVVVMSLSGLWTWWALSD